MLYFVTHFQLLWCWKPRGASLGAFLALWPYCSQGFSKQQWETWSLCHTASISLSSCATTGPWDVRSVSSLGINAVSPLPLGRAAVWAGDSLWLGWFHQNKRESAAGSGWVPAGDQFLSLCSVPREWHRLPERYRDPASLFCPLDWNQLEFVGSTWQAVCSLVSPVISFSGNCSVCKVALFVKSW